MLEFLQVHRMRKVEFIDMVAKKLDMSQKEAEKIYEVVFSSVVDSLRKTHSFKVVGLGTFSVVRRAARKGINLQTGKPLTIPAKNVLKFKVSKKLKEEIASSTK